MTSVSKGTKVRAVGFRDTAHECRITEGRVYETLLDSFGMYGYIYTAVINDSGKRLVCRLHRFEVVE